MERRATGIEKQLRAAQEAERKARVAVLLEAEAEAFDAFVEAVDALSDGPATALANAQKAVRSAGGYEEFHRARRMMDAIAKFRQGEAMRENRTNWEREQGVL